MAIAVFTSWLQLTDNSGNLLSGGTVTVQDANTTTPRACYTDTGLSVSATNPIPINSAGRHTQGIIYISAAAYKVIIKTAAGATVATYDNIDPGVPLGSGVLAIVNGGTGAATAEAAIAALGGSTAAEVADIAADVAALSGALASTEKTHIATGTTAQRAAVPIEGDIRRNTTTSRYEGYNNSAAWETFFTNTEIASSAEAIAGTDNTKVMTPSRAESARSAKARTRAFTASGSTTTAGSGAYTYSSGTAPTTSQEYREDSVTLTHTAKVTGNRLKFTYQFVAAGASSIAVALFQDSDANAVDWQAIQGTDNGSSYCVVFDIAASNASSHIYKIRLVTISSGPAAAPTRRHFMVEEYA